MNNFSRLIICLLTVSLLTGFTYGYKNNPQTGKPDMVVTAVASGDLPVFGNASTAKRLTTGRTLGITGPITYNSPAFDGSGNVTAAATVTSQTGTGSKFVMDASPTLITPNIGAATAPSIKTASGSVSCPNGTPTTLFSTTTDGMYLVYVTLGDAINFGAYATIIAYGGVARIVATNAGYITLTVSGLAVQASQGSGATNPVGYTYLLIK